MRSRMVNLIVVLSVLFFIPNVSYAMFGLDSGSSPAGGAETEVIAGNGDPAPQDEENPYIPTTQDTNVSSTSLEQALAVHMAQGLLNQDVLSEVDYSQQGINALYAKVEDVTGINLGEKAANIEIALTTSGRDGSTLLEDLQAGKSGAKDTLEDLVKASGVKEELVGSIAGEIATHLAYGAEGYISYMEGKNPEAFGLSGDVKMTEGVDAIGPAIQVAVLKDSIIAEGTELTDEQTKTIVEAVVENGGAYRYLTEGGLAKVAEALGDAGIALREGYQYKGEGGQDDNSYIMWASIYDRAMAAAAGVEGQDLEGVSVSQEFKDLVSENQRVNILQQAADKIRALVASLGVALSSVRDAAQ
jgi:hypothetical protein